MRGLGGVVTWVLIFGCGGAPRRSDRPPDGYRDGESAFAAMRAEPVIFMPQHETTEGLLVELQSTLAAYGGRADVALQGYQRAEPQPWRLRAVIRAVEAYRFAAEAVSEARIMLPLDVREEMEARPEVADDVEAGFRAQVQSLLQQTAQRLRCRAQRALEEMLPSRKAGGDREDLRTVERLRAELTGACGAVR